MSLWTLPGPIPEGVQSSTTLQTVIGSFLANTFPCMLETEHLYRILIRHSNCHTANWTWSHFAGGFSAFYQRASFFILLVGFIVFGKT